MGDIERHHTAVVMARRAPPRPGEMAEVPILNDATTRQARMLDERRRQLEEETEEERRAREAETAVIQVQMNGVWMDQKVKVASLRNALGLPPYPLFSQGIFHGYTHNTRVTGGDMEDVDHLPQTQNNRQSTTAASRERPIQEQKEDEQKEEEEKDAAGDSDEDIYT